MDLSHLKPVAEADVAGKRVMVRADLNVPMRDGLVSDATRVERFAPTVRDLAARGAKVIVLSHFDRPKGKRVPDMSLAPVAACLQATLAGQSVAFAQDCVGPDAADAVAMLENGEIVVLENTRFHPGEEENDAAFAKALAENADIYVNDAFSCAHRAHASTEGIARLLPSYVGGQMMAEINALRTALDDPERPVAALVGGAKVSTKIPVLMHLMDRVDMLIIGGGMANTFLHAQGHDVGKSLCEPDLAGKAREIMDKAARTGCEILLPMDTVVAREFKAGAENHVAALDAVPGDAMILDVGPATLDLLKSKLATCRTMLWNGPLGAFETEPFGAATFELAHHAADLTRQGSLISVAGGGDTVAALNVAGVADQLTYVSTAGGAFLEWLEGRTLPGVAVLAEAA